MRKFDIHADYAWQILNLTEINFPVYFRQNAERLRVRWRLAAVSRLLEKIRLRYTIAWLR